MIGQMQEIVTEKTQALAEQVQKLRKESAETVREAVAASAESLKAMKSPVRLFARSGIKVTSPHSMVLPLPLWGRARRPPWRSKPPSVSVPTSRRAGSRW